DVENSSDNAFWESLQANITSILFDDQAEAAADATNSPHIMLNRESGLIGVRATQRQHKDVQAFIDEVLTSSQRQVLIEATIAEVKLSDRYQAGIDWSLVRQNDADRTTT